MATWTWNHKALEGNIHEESHRMLLRNSLHLMHLGIQYEVYNNLGK